MPVDLRRYKEEKSSASPGSDMSATTTPEEAPTALAVPALDDFDFPLTDGAACRIDDPDCEACQ
jgi:hypothetical protein